jgi:drug/metabolite transporter (DMT)-like permease
MMALTPLVGVLINWLFRGRPPLKFSLFFVLLAFVGALLVVTRGDGSSLFRLKDHVLANVLILLGAICWAVYTIGASAFPGWSSLRYTALTTTLGVATIWLINLTLGVLGCNSMPGFAALLSVWAQFVYMIGISGVLGVLAWNAGNKILTPVNGVLFMNVVPVTTMVLSAFQGYRFNWAELLGTGLTVTALLLNNVCRRLTGGGPQTSTPLALPRPLPVQPVVKPDHILA